MTQRYAHLTEERLRKGSAVIEKVIEKVMDNLNTPMKNKNNSKTLSNS